MSSGSRSRHCRWRHAHLTDPPEPVDLSRIDAPDLGIVELLARAQLEAMRRAERLLLTGAGEDLRGLVDLCGLADVVGLGPVEPAAPRRPEE